MPRKPAASHLSTLACINQVAAVWRSMCGVTLPGSFVNATAVNVISESAGSSRMFQVRGPQMVAGRYYKPTATVKTYLKDVGIINNFAVQMCMPAPLFAAAAQYYYACMGQGRGEQDTASVCAISSGLAEIPQK